MLTMGWGSNKGGIQRPTAPSPHTPTVGPARHFSSRAVARPRRRPPTCPQGSSPKPALCLCQHRCLLQRLRVGGLREAAVGINFCLQPVWTDASLKTQHSTQLSRQDQAYHIGLRAEEMCLLHHFEKKQLFTHFDCWTNI